MIDFEKATLLKLAPIDPRDIADTVGPLIIPGEELRAAFKTVRDFVVFTNKRVIAVNVQGMTGKKKDFTTLPYNKIQAFSVETAGHFDLDAELDLWFSGLGRVRFEFRGRSDIRAISQLIASCML
jgi:hypothetical protein